MAIIKDMYDLKYSTQFVNEGIQESQIDLVLETSTVGGSSVTGTVTDPTGNPIDNATIKLFDKDGVPYLHTLTNELGQYTFADLNSDNYSITAVKDGYVITLPYGFFLQEEDTFTHQFVIEAEKSLELSSIAGHIYTMDDAVKKMLHHANVALLDAVTRDAVATTFSADDGEYLFYGIEAGTYILKVTMQGYNASTDIAINAIDNTIVNMDIQLTVDPTDNVGTISGFVKNNSNGLTGCFVGLYEVNRNTNTEKLIATTKTNAQGMYMFGNVPTGEYKVKAKQIK